MSKSHLHWGTSLICLVATGAARADPQGLLADWTFDEGQGNSAASTSGNGLDAKIFGATWVPQGYGFTLAFDGLDDYLSCATDKTLPIDRPITIEAWIKPMAKRSGAHVTFRGIALPLSGWLLRSC